MSQFYEDAPAGKPKPVDPDPLADGTFANAGSYGFGWNQFAYRSRKCTLIDLLHPRYFRVQASDFNLSRGDRIACFVGEPEDGVEVVLRVCSVDRHRGVVRVSKANSQGKFAFITHPEFDKSEKAA